ncbi:MAG: peptide deformylase [Lentisphaeraceae bacterium]|nr:peptide deformylase [Lentisphaeraceae bacterium]
MGFFSKSKSMDVKTYGNPVLRKDCEPVKDITDEIRKLTEEMIQCMYDENGIGLAAPQIGINKRIFVIDTNVDDEAIHATPGEAYLSPKMPMALINPEIVSASGPDIPFVEGCLSIPGVNATVYRPDVVRLKATTIDGESIDLECGGLLSRCVQHELDHLNGVLFTDKAVEEEVETSQDQLDKLKAANQRKLSKKRKRR